MNHLLYESLAVVNMLTSFALTCPLSATYVQVRRLPPSLTRHSIQTMTLYAHLLNVLAGGGPEIPRI